MLTPSRLSQHSQTLPSASASSSSSSSQPRREISLKALSQLPDDVQLQILPPDTLTREILEIRRPEARSEEAGKQRVRFRFLEKHLPLLGDDWKNNVLLHTLRKNHPSLFNLVFKHTDTPDMPALLGASVQARNDEVFDGLLQRTPVPIPAESLNETMECLALYGQPEKLEHLLARQPQENHPAADEIEELSHLARTQQQKIRDFSQQSPEESTETFMKRQWFDFSPDEMVARLQHPNLNANARNTRFINGYTPLQAAIAKKDPFTFQVLLADPRVNVNAIDSTGQTALHTTIAWKQGDMMDTLLELPEIEVNTRNRQGKTPLEMAVHSQYKEAVELLLKRPDIDYKSQDSRANTLLHHAASGGDPDIIQALIEKGLDVNARNHKGETPLHRAVLAQKVDAVKTLLKAPQLKINVRNKEGLTPLGAASVGNDPTIPELLRQHGATE